MKFKYILGFLLLFLNFTIFSQTPISGVVNSYVKVTSLPSCNPCDNSCNTLNVASTAGFAVGNRVVIMQMKGATASTIASPSFGEISNYNQAGAYEFNTIASIVGTTITMTSTLNYPYDVAGLVQLIRVPVYPSATITGTLLGTPWNGNIGGAIIIEVTGNLTANAGINANGIGFRGGVSVSNGFSYPCGLTDYYYSDPTFDNAALKGEGISDLIIGYELGKGAWTNAGGGGNSHNGGGGGGGNGGAGGRGGNDYCSGSALSGGIGGYELNTNYIKVFLGGSGGAGHQNNSVGTSGANGGGIVIIRAGSITGNNNIISSNGLDAANTPGSGNDGAGGGGAGGSILLDIPTYTGLLQLTANGGKGGNMTFASAGHAPGGGGAGGIIATTGAALPVGVTPSVLGGINGIISVNSSPFNATPGAPGKVLTNFTIINSVGPAKLNANLGSDVTLCDPISVTLNAGQTDPSYTYTWRLNNTLISNSTPSLVTSTPGVYTVTVSSPGCLDGLDTVTIFTQTATPFHANFCAPPAQVVPLSVTGPGKYKWFTASVGGTEVAKGTSYNPTLSATTTFYVEDTSAFKYGNFTPKNMLSGFTVRTGGSNTYMGFNVSKAFVLDSVSMFIRTYDTNTQTMEIRLRQVGNPVPLATKSLLVTGPCNCLTDREVQFNLGFNIPVGNNYYLEYSSGSVSVHWDNGGASYPYSIPGIVSITQPVDGNGNYIGWASTSYGFFYNWKISAGITCLRVPVVATLNCSLPIETISLEVNCKGNSSTIKASIISSEKGKAILEYSNDMLSIVEVSASEIHIIPGFSTLDFNFINSPNENPKYFRIKLSNGNKDTYCVWVTSSCDSDDFTIAPIPSSDNFTIASQLNKEVHYSVFNVTGKKCLEGISKTPFKFGENLLPGIYFITINNEDKVLVYKIIKN